MAKLYNLAMTVSVTATQARQRWAETLDDALREPVEITSHGRLVAVVMDAALAKRALQALEDAADVEAADAALAEAAAGAPTVSLAEVAEELGITLDAR